MIDFDKILEEVSWRIKSGMPDFSREEDITVLLEVMNELGIDTKVSLPAIARLREKRQTK